MGCDIHLVVEKKMPNGRWCGVFSTGDIMYRNWGEEFIPIIKYAHRDYAFFALLASVRGEGPLPKGVPEDPSDLTQMLFMEWGSDGHTPSYESLYDFVRLKLLANSNLLSIATAKKLEGKDPILAEIAHCFGYVHIDEAHARDDWRVVFFFDN